MYLRSLSIIALAILFSALFSADGFATSDTVVGNMLCTMTTWADGSLGRGIATLTAIILGILAILNKISWKIVLVHIVGAALLIGSSSMVNSLGAGGTGC